MKWIGLTGGIGSGKSSVAKLLRQEGVEVIDADAISHFITQKNSPGLALVVKEFGKDVLDQGGELNRKKLGEMVFSDKKKLFSLEKILHPLIREEATIRRQALALKKIPYAIYDVPLLFEKNLAKDFDKIIVVTCSEQQQIDRIIKRDKLSLEDVKKRLSAQIPLEEKTKKADFVIENSGSLEELKSKVKDLMNKF